VSEPATRLPYLRVEDLTESQQELYHAITDGPLSALGEVDLTDGSGALGDFAALFLSPQVGDAVQRLGAAVLFYTHLTPRIRELAILAVTVDRDCEFERSLHADLALAAGFRDAEIAAILKGASPELTDPEEIAALRLTMSLLEGDVDDETWAACVPPLEPAVAFELVALVGHYSMLAVLLRVFRAGQTPQ
jgi:4-carboxymuconolactone decarboxylase